MPRFSVRRKTKPVQPEEPLEVKVDDQEVSMESSYSESEESEPLSEQFETLKVAQTPVYASKPETRPQVEPVRRTRSASVAQWRPNVARYRQNNPPRRPMDPPGYQNRRSVQYAKPLRSQNGSRKMQYGSHYGPGGNSLTTQEKARLLYHSCFG